MVGRRASVVAALLCTALLAAGSGSAEALKNAKTTAQPVKTTDSYSGNGAPARVRAGHCALYATANPFGASCPVHGTDAVNTVDLILSRNHEHMPTCWDDILQNPDREVVYYIQPTDLNTYSIRSCVSNIKGDRTPTNQPDEQLDQSEVDLGVDPPPCPRPYLDAALEQQCVMSLTDVQTTIVGANGPHGQIPSALLATLPSQRIRTNELVTYFSTAMPAGSADPKRTATYDVEPGIQMWAVMTGSFFLPYGPNTTPAIPCDITMQSGPTACRWAYPASSGGQVNAVYPTRLETDWVVQYREGGVTKQLGGTFKKFDDVGLPVFDVQSIVIP